MTLPKFVLKGTSAGIFLYVSAIYS